MAIIDAAQQITTGLPNSGSTAYWKWSGLTSANATGAAVPVGFAQTSLTFLCEGTWNTGTLTIQASFDGVKWVSLNKATGSSATATADTLLSASDLPLFVRPLLSGAGTDNVNVHLLVK